MNNNMVYNPSHYNHAGRKECWDEMRDLFGDSAVVIFDVLNAYKYMYRAGTKDGNPEEQDWAKIKNYLSHALNLIDTNDFEQISNATDVFGRMMDIVDNGFNPWKE